MNSERRLFVIIQSAKERYTARGLKLPRPYWDVEGERCSWQTAVTCVQVELKNLNGAQGYYYGLLEAHAQFLISCPHLIVEEN